MSIYLYLHIIIYNVIIYIIFFKVSSITSMVYWCIIGGFELHILILVYHLQPLAQQVKLYIKNTNHFLSKLKTIGKLPQGAILCTIDVVGLYPNIAHSEGLTSLRRFLELRDNKQIPSDTLIELAEIVLKNKFFEFDEKTVKQVRGTAIGAELAPPYTILFMADLEEKNSQCF